ncbi:MAG: hypothetical protein JRI46_07675 [Deltaproteobacteria bacterium]|nr:hypothetical protein [Deltaproteobacteria bacterium]
MASWGRDPASRPLPRDSSSSPKTFCIQIDSPKAAEEIEEIIRRKSRGRWNMCNSWWRPPNTCAASPPLL